MNTPFDHDPPSSTRERVALLELRLDYCARSVEETRDILRDLDKKFDDLVLQLAKDRKASLPPTKRKTLLTTAGVSSIIPGVLYALQQIFSPQGQVTTAPMVANKAPQVETQGR
jgi:hypothetical protein